MKQPQILLLKHRTVVTIKLNILRYVKRAKIRKKNIYHDQVNDVVPEIEVKSNGNLTIKHLICHAFTLVLGNQSSAFSKFLSSRKKKENRSTAFLTFTNVCFHYTDLFLADTKHNPKEWYIYIYVLIKPCHLIRCLQSLMVCFKPTDKVKTVLHRLLFRR